MAGGRHGGGGLDALTGQSTIGAMPPGTAAVVLDSVDSTNEEARRRAAAGEPGPLWIAARRQTAGRGRRGRAWVSKPGNLFASLLLRPGVSAAKAGHLSFVAALAVTDAVGTLAGLGDRLTCKWPNDVLLDGHKLAGILLESSAGQGGVIDWVVIGIGINLAHHPDRGDYPTTSLAAATGARIHVEQALSALAEAFAARYEEWHTAGFAPVRTAWLARAAGLGETVTVRLGAETFAGRFDDLDEDGALLVTVPGRGQRRVHAGEVFAGGGTAR